MFNHARSKETFLVCLHVCVHACVCVRACVNACMHVCMHMHVCTCVLCVHACVYVCVHVHVLKHMHVCVHMCVLGGGMHCEGHAEARGRLQVYSSCYLPYSSEIGYFMEPGA